MDFVAVDVETANPDLASICQIGVVAFQGRSVKEAWETTVNPEDYFDDNNEGHVDTRNANFECENKDPHLGCDLGIDVQG